MRKADDQDLRDALSEEVENLEPHDELWNKIYKRSVVQQEKKKRPWLTGALAMGAAAAVAAVFLFYGTLGPKPPDNGAPGPVALTYPPGETTSPVTPTAEPHPGFLPPVEPPRIMVAPVDQNHTTLPAPGETPGTLPAPGPGGTTNGFAPDPTDGRLSVTYNHTVYWHNGEHVTPADLGDLLTLTTAQAAPGAPLPDGYSTTLPAGKEMRAIQGTDPARRIAVQTDQGWLAFDNILKSLP